MGLWQRPGPGEEAGPGTDNPAVSLNAQILPTPALVLTSVRGKKGRRKEKTLIKRIFKKTPGEK